LVEPASRAAGVVSVWSARIRETTGRVIESRPSWVDVEALARQRIQIWFQRLLEEEVEELSSSPP
jgi:hypothetical protein